MSARRLFRPFRETRSYSPARTKAVRAFLAGARETDTVRTALTKLRARIDDNLVTEDDKRLLRHMGPKTRASIGLTDAEVERLTA